MAGKKLTTKKPPARPDLIRAIALAPDVDTGLQQLSQDASDYIGRTVSSSAIVRALVRYATQQGSPVADAVFGPGRAGIAERHPVGQTEVSY